MYLTRIKEVESMSSSQNSKFFSYHFHQLMQVRCHNGQTCANMSKFESPPEIQEKLPKNGYWLVLVDSCLILVDPWLVPGRFLVGSDWFWSVHRIFSPMFMDWSLHSHERKVDLIDKSHGSGLSVSFKLSFR